MLTANKAGGPLAYAGQPLSAADFQRFRDLAYQRFGLDLREGKQDLVAARLGKRMRQRGIASFSDYYRMVVSDSSGESLIELIDALTTNHTSFLRERAHFDLLGKLVREAGTAAGSLQIWSAASSTGEEPYTILFTILEANPSLATGRVAPLVLATDISTRALQLATKAAYSRDRLRDLPESWLRNWFIRDSDSEVLRVKPDIARLVEFRRMNLIEPFHHGRTFDFIFCRNVMIYFDRRTQQDLIGRLHACLKPGGYLLVGHSESLSGIEHPFAYVRPAVYRRKPGSR
ncbi:MAG TPA: protein-glutamate O-methyltransferase CheR [Bryobacteraceae bacterium]|nr:protein-glutamate O-methyltransferase CheR [Bryobacteraceae bacterium]